MFILGKRMGCLEEQIPPDCHELIDQMNIFFITSQNLMLELPLIVFYETKNYKKLMQTFKRIYDISMAHIQKRLDEIEGEQSISEDDEPPVGMDFLQYMSMANKMPLEEITTNAIDLMSAGIEENGIFGITN